MTPWTARNYRVTGAFLPVSTGAGTAFWLGNYPGNYGYDPYDTTRVNDLWLYLPVDLSNAVRGMSEIQQDQYLASTAMGYIREDPVRAIGICAHKLSILWLGGLGEYAGRRHPGQSFLLPFLISARFSVPLRCLFACPVFFLSILGAWLAGRVARYRALPVFLLLVFWTAAYVAFYAEPRYAAAVSPYEWGFAAIAVVHIWDRFVGCRR